MRVRVQVIIEADDDAPPAVYDVAKIERADEVGIDTLGLHLAEALFPFSAASRRFFLVRKLTTKQGNLSSN